MTTSLGIVIVEPLGVVRAGIALIVEAEPDLNVVAQAASAEEALRALSKIRRSRLVVLVGLPIEDDARGRLMREIRERHPSHSVLAMAGDAAVADVSRALFAGADGFIDTSVGPEDLVAGIRTAAEHDLVLAGPNGRAIGEIANDIDRRRRAGTILTRREQEVLAAAADGLTAKEIGIRLGVRERTITTHLSKIYAKLGVRNRLGAVQFAERSGLGGS